MKQLTVAQQMFLEAVDDDPEFADAVRRFLAAISAAFRDVSDEHMKRMAAFGRLAALETPAAATASGSSHHPTPPSGTSTPNETGDTQ